MTRIKRPLLSLPASGRQVSTPAYKPSSTTSWATDQLAGQTIKLIELASLLPGRPLRPIVQSEVVRLSRSIDCVGPVSPITALHCGDGIYEQLNGWHRTAAYRLLGHTRVAAIILSAPSVDVELYALVEDIYRVGLSALDKGLFLNRYRRHVQAKVLQSEAPFGGSQPAEKGIRKCAIELGVNPVAVARAEKIGRLKPEAIERIRALGLQDNQSALLKIAISQTAEGQIETARVIAERPKTPKLSKPTKSSDLSLANSIISSPVPPVIAAPNVVLLDQDPAMSDQDNCTSRNDDEILSVVEKNRPPKTLSEVGAEWRRSAVFQLVLSLSRDERRQFVDCILLPSIHSGGT